MARPFNEKEIKQRIKDNKTIAAQTRKEVTGAMAIAIKGNGIDADMTRQTLAAFIKATRAMAADTIKLANLAESKKAVKK